MANAKYYVFKKVDLWKVGYDGKDCAYSSNVAAVVAAIKAAKGAASRGYEAEVLAQSIDGKWRTEWAAE
ncbi:hypothetical protein DBIPINDM_008174 (plasmid) [Mesorhizobium sp. AR02]|uniref:hypothetical protein n=1 Tax=Mesorhizobium sp. AR02 TaxID=2865837 RepID=UPI00215E872B|nr:hypothetical protein [Mesorhizobium sp. AR02]UVK57570.1 hypothetical protein DBIPINDM_008174 [Mesorhizobium sp. AR02]